MDKYVKHYLESKYPQIILWGRSAADFGCGLGGDSIELALRGADVLALDKSLDNLRKVKNAADLYGVELSLEQANLVDYQPIKKYDIVFFNFVLHFIKEEHQLRVLQNVIDSVKPGGVLVFSDLEDTKKVPPEILALLLDNLTDVRSETFIQKDQPHPGMNFPHQHKILRLLGERK